METVTIRPLRALREPEIRGLSDVLIDCVEGGASVSFMLPMTRAKAEAFWRSAAGGAARGERVILVAEDASGAMVGTVTIILQQPENQPHRADVAKMLVHRRARGQGIGAALLQAAEAAARDQGKSVLVLDTVTDSAAARLYERLGWKRVGDIPDYALMPEGGFCSTTIYFLNLRRPRPALVALS